PLPVKTIQIYEIEILGFGKWESLPTAKLRVLCGKGTYIRSLARDLGKDLGVGGVLVNLIRTKVGDFSIEDAKRASELKM
ncbi:tRNA pseudouridine(55) synthase, partial [Patescibacteria group bacterium]